MYMLAHMHFGPGCKPSMAPMSHTVLTSSLPLPLQLVYTQPGQQQPATAAGVAAALRLAHQQLPQPPGAAAWGQGRVSAST
jgi:hypothetical protein